MTHGTWSRRPVRPGFGAGCIVKGGELGVLTPGIKDVGAGGAPTRYSNNHTPGERRDALTGRGCDSCANNVMCYWKSAGVNAAEMRAIYSTQAQSRNVQRALAADVDVNCIQSHTHTLRWDAAADVRRGGDAVTSLGRRWQPSAVLADPLLQLICLHWLFHTLTSSLVFLLVFSPCLTCSFERKADKVYNMSLHKAVLERRLVLVLGEHVSNSTPTTCQSCAHKHTHWHTAARCEAHVVSWP